MRGGPAGRRAGGRTDSVRLWRAGVALVVLSACPLARLPAWQCPDGTPPPCRTAAAAPRTAAAGNSVAVLYFDNRSSDTGDVYLADGLTEEVISRLSGVERLSVRSRHLVRRYRGSELTDPAAVGRTLNVAFLVTGSVRRAGGRLRVSAELVQASSGSQVWGRQFDQAGGDVFAIQEAVAREVATGIVGRLVPAEQRAVAARPTANPAAYLAYLRGNFSMARRDSAGFARAIQEYETALRLDPGFTDALSRLSLVYSIAEVNAQPLPMPRESVLARSMRAAEEAVRRAPASSDAWLAMGRARSFANSRLIPPTLEALRRAVTLDSTNAEAHHHLGALLQDLLELDSAETHHRRALEIEPARPITLINFAERALRRDRPDQALRWLDSTMAIAPDFMSAHSLRLVALLTGGDSAAARREVAGWESIPSLRGAMGWAQQVMALDRRDSAAVAALRAVWFPPDGEPMPTTLGAWVASVYAALGDREHALLALERTKPGLALWAGMQDRRLAQLSGEPRYQAVLAATAPIMSRQERQ